jgi:hypothetical protein
MKTKLAMSAVVAAVAMLSQAAVAQTTAPASRADVKSEAKSGSLARPGEALATQPGPQASGAMSTKSRAERKGETKAAADAGALKPAGEASHKADDRAEKMKGGTQSRAERKAETATGAKVPAGEALGSQPGPQTGAPVTAPKKP